jgi:hypothetical protein
LKYKTSVSHHWYKLFLHSAVFWICVETCLYNVKFLIIYKTLVWNCNKEILTWTIFLYEQVWHLIISG